jgi:carbon storage regulator
MLVLTRRVGESICVGNDVVVTVVQVAPGKVRIGIQAPGDMTILREELVDRAAKSPLVFGAAPIADAAVQLPSSEY